MSGSQTPTMDTWTLINANAASLSDGLKRSLIAITGDRGSGAGTIWHREGLIVTNAHVIGDGALRVALHTGETLPAKVLALDRAQDLAALCVEAQDLPTIELGDSRYIRPGEVVFALGHPWGIQETVMAGTVIGIGAVWPELPFLQGEWLAVDIPLRPGNSGGALVDVQGRLIGVNTMLNGPDVGIAVPVNRAKAFLKRNLVATQQ